MVYLLPKKKSKLKKIVNDIINRQAQFSLTETSPHSFQHPIREIHFPTTLSLSLNGGYHKVAHIHGGAANVRRVRLLRCTLSQLWQRHNPLPAQHGPRVRGPVVQDPVRRGVAQIRYAQQQLPDHVHHPLRPTVRDQALELPPKHLRHLGYCPPGRPAEQQPPLQRHQQQHNPLPQLYQRPPQITIELLVNQSLPRVRQQQWGRGSMRGRATLLYVPCGRVVHLVHDPGPAVRV